MIMRNDALLKIKYTPLSIVKVDFIVKKEFFNKPDHDSVFLKKAVMVIPEEIFGGAINSIWIIDKIFLEPYPSNKSRICHYIGIYI
jgi:hypothetical protein